MSLRNAEDLENSTQLHKLKSRSKPLIDYALFCWNLNIMVHISVGNSISKLKKKIFFQIFKEFPKIILLDKSRNSDNNS